MRNIQRVISVVPVLLSVLLLLSCSGEKKGTDAKNDRDAEIDRKVKELLSKMTVEEKVGQMTQVNLSVATKGGYDSKDGAIDTALLEDAILKYKVGSILNVVPTAYTLEHWQGLLTLVQNTAMKSPNKIPVLYGIDAIHGATYTQNSTLFPHNIAKAATRNPELVGSCVRVCALETRASGIRWNFDPVVDIGRNPLWSRFPETFGEDVYLVKVFGSSAISTYQGDDIGKPINVAACMKHFIGYSDPRSGKDRTPAYIPEIQLREYFLPGFQAAVDAGVATVMINSGDVNGIPCHANKYLLQDVLRKELGFTGVAVSDWEDIIRLHTRHKVADSPKEAVRMAVMAGVDMSMVPNDFSFYTLLVELVNEGAVPMERIDEAVGRILTLKFKLGLFDNPFPEKNTDQFGKPEYTQIALDAAHECMTLLKNDSVKGAPVLPLAKNTRVLLCGPGANALSSLNGCWSYTWQGDDNTKFPATYKTIAQVFTERYGKQVTNISEPWRKDGSSYDLAAVKRSAASADVIVLCLGEDAHAENPGIINDLNMDPNQMELARVAIATGKPVILVLTEGRPRIIREIVPGVKAVLQAYWPGSQGAQAITDVLFGDYNPSGKLPYSYPKYPNILITYDLKHAEVKEERSPGKETPTGYDVQFPFGAGLSYTTFAYSNLSVSKDSIKGTDSVVVKIDVQNTGQKEGKEVIELYTHDQYASITPCERRLRAFQKVLLKPGEKKTITFTLSAQGLAFVNAEMKTVTEDGMFDVLIGGQQKSFYYKN